MTHQDPFQAAETFLQHSARLLERLRFEHLYRSHELDASRERVLAALRPYQNPDGGFGQVLEPDFRGPVSQPLCTEQAFRVLSELGGSGLLSAPWVTRALTHLRSITAPDGGVPNVLTTAAAYPRAPWWQPDPAQVGSLLPTASLAGLLLRHGVEHAWLEGAIAFTWRALDALPARLAAASERLALLHALYETRAALVFLDHTRERPRAEQAAERLGRALHDRGVFDGRAGEAELASPLDFATHPGSLARRWFDDARVEGQLDAMLAAQQADGGFPLSWHVWTPLAGLEWRGIVTLQRLHTLSAYGRLASAAR